MVLLYVFASYFRLLDLLACIVLSFHIWLLCRFLSLDTGSFCGHISERYSSVPANFLVFSPLALVSNCIFRLYPCSLSVLPLRCLSALCISYHAIPFHFISFHSFGFTLDYITLHCTTLLNNHTQTDTHTRIYVCVYVYIYKCMYVYMHTHVTCMLHA